MNFCESDMLEIIELLGSVLMIFKIAVPFILIAIGIFIFVKAIIDGKDDSIKKATMQLIKKVIAGMIIFFLPGIVNTIFGFIDVPVTNCVRCFLDKEYCKVRSENNSKNNSENNSNNTNNYCSNFDEKECKSNSECSWEKVSDYNVSVGDSQGNYCVNIYFKK